MLEYLDAEELNDWQAYEILRGPLDRTYDSEMLAQIHEQLKLLRRENARSEKPIDPTPRPWRTPEDEMTEEQKAEQEAAEKQATLNALDLALEAQTQKRGK